MSVLRITCAGSTKTLIIYQSPIRMIIKGSGEISSTEEVYNIGRTSLYGLLYAVATVPQIFKLKGQTWMLAKPGVLMMLLQLVSVKG